MCQLTMSDNGLEKMCPYSVWFHLRYLRFFTNFSRSGLIEAYLVHPLDQRNPTISEIETHRKHVNTTLDGNTTQTSHVSSDDEASKVQMLSRLMKRQRAPNEAEQSRISAEACRLENFRRLFRRFFLCGHGACTLFEQKYNATYESIVACQ